MMKINGITEWGRVLVVNNLRFLFVIHTLSIGFTWNQYSLKHVTLFAELWVPRTWKLSLLNDIWSNVYVNVVEYKTPFVLLETRFNRSENKRSYRGMLFDHHQDCSHFCIHIHKIQTCWNKNDHINPLHKSIRHHLQYSRDLLSFLQHVRLKPRLRFFVGIAKTFS